MEDRLLKLLDTEQLSSSKFADVIGVQRSSISHILSGRNKPSFDFLQKILRAFPMLNADWLILGEGPMYEGESEPVRGNLFDQPAIRNSSQEVEPARTEPETSPVSDPDYDSEIEAAVAVRDAVRAVNGDDAPPSVKDDAASAGKSISRIILLYDDRTFHAYDPG